MNPPRGVLLFDTSVYIRHIGDGAFSWLAEDSKIISRSILTVVVAAELYAGARDAEEKEQLDALCQWHGALRTLSHPSADSWLHGGASTRMAASFFAKEPSTLYSSTRRRV